MVCIGNMTYTIHWVQISNALSCHLLFSVHLQALDWLSLISPSPDLQNQRLQTSLTGAPKHWESLLILPLQKNGWYLRDFSAPSFPLLFYKSPLFQHTYICDGFLAHHLKPCNLYPYKRASFWTPSHLIPLVASRLEAFSWPFTLLSNWLCIQHRFLPNCLSQHELLCYSASLCSLSFSTIKEHATVSTTG